MSSTRSDTGGLGLSRREARTLARRAGLRYVSSDDAGIVRRRRGRGFSYRHESNGSLVRNKQTRARIDALAIPPAWEEVWITREPMGHLQARGRDASGRLQYRYHDRWTQLRAELKFDRLILFAERLPRLRRRADRDLAGTDLSRRRVLAAAVRLMDLTLMRPGHASYTRSHGSRGLTTLRGANVSFEDAAVRLAFVGKSRQDREVEAEDERLAPILKRCRKLPGSRLLEYREAGVVRAIEPRDLNAYIGAATGEALTAKTFRAWGGTVLAARALAIAEPADSERERRRQVVAAGRLVAERLGNRPATARAHYIHPAVVRAHEEDRLRRLVTHARALDRSVPRQSLSVVEKDVLRLLQRRP